MNKNNVMLSIVLVCTLVTQTAVCAQDKAGLINKAQETYRTFKKDMKCVFSKQPCTRAQKKRLIKQGTALTGIGGGLGGRAFLKRRGKRKYVINLPLESSDEESQSDEDSEEEEFEKIGQEPKIVPKGEDKPVSIPQISEEVKRRAELELKLRKATLEAERRGWRPYKYPMSKKPIQAAVPVEVPLVVVGAEETQKKSAPKTTIKSTLDEEFVWVKGADELVIPKKYQKYLSIPPQKTGNVKNDMDALHKIQLKLRGQTLTSGGEMRPIDQDVFKNIVRYEEDQELIPVLYSEFERVRRESAPLTYDIYDKIYAIYKRAGLWK